MKHATYLSFVVCIVKGLLLCETICDVCVYMWGRPDGKDAEVLKKMYIIFANNNEVF